MTRTTVEILDSNFNLVTFVKSFIPLDKTDTILTYSKELSDFGTARFRISAYDTDFANIGDITTPLLYHVRIRRGETVVWQGAIVENPMRTKDFIEVVAVEYIWFLSKILITRSSINPGNGVADKIYRIFNTANGSTTMAQAVTDIMNETIARFQSTNHVLSSLTLGTVENPNFPPNMSDGNTPPKALTGPWHFGDGVTAPSLQFEFNTVLYVLQSFGVYTFADFEIDENLQFNFKSFLGNDHHYDVNFVYGRQGNMVDFNVSRLGQRMVNDLWGLAVDPSGAYLHSEQPDITSIQSLGLLEAVAAYGDVKDQATLDARTAAELPLVDTPDSSANTYVLSEKAYPLGVYDVGDIVTININTPAVSYNQVDRIVGLTVGLNSTGRELTTVQTNKPRPGEYGAA